MSCPAVNIGPCGSLYFRIAFGVYTGGYGSDDCLTWADGNVAAWAASVDLSPCPWGSYWYGAFATTAQAAPSPAAARFPPIIGGVYGSFRDADGHKYTIESEQYLARGQVRYSDPAPYYIVEFTHANNGAGTEICTGPQAVPTVTRGCTGTTASYFWALNCGNYVEIGMPPAPGLSMCTNPCPMYSGRNIGFSIGITSVDDVVFTAYAALADYAATFGSPPNYGPSWNPAQICNPSYEDPFDSEDP